MSHYATKAGETAPFIPGARVEKRRLQRAIAIRRRSRAVAIIRLETLNFFWRV
jgi:hypothetical protein